MNGEQFNNGGEHMNIFKRKLVFNKVRVAFICT